MAYTLTDRSPRATVLSMNKVWRLIATAVVAVCGIVHQAIGQGGQASNTAIADTENQHQSDVTFSNYKFRDGETLQAVAYPLHDIRKSS